MKNPAILFYKGYRTKPEYYPDDKIYYGTLIGIRDFVDFQAERAEDIEKEFHDSVDDYLEFCKEIGKEPEREFNGLINLHIPSELHMDISMYAEAQGVTLNKAVEQAIRAMVQG